MRISDWSSDVCSSDLSATSRASTGRVTPSAATSRPAGTGSPLASRASRSATVATRGRGIGHLYFLTIKKRYMSRPPASNGVNGGFAGVRFVCFFTILVIREFGNRGHGRSHKVLVQRSEGQHGSAWGGEGGCS